MKKMYTDARFSPRISGAKAHGSLFVGYYCTAACNKAATRWIGPSSSGAMA